MANQPSDPGFVNSALLTDLASHMTSIKQISPFEHVRTASRRHLLQVGYSGLMGLGLNTFIPRSTRAADAVPRAKSLIIVFCTGAISHHDTFDMKPNAPAEIRGEFNPCRLCWMTWTKVGCLNRHW